MTIAGWIFMLMSWGATLGLTVYCFARALEKKSDKSGKSD